MTSHELAKKLLEYPDLPVATHALNATYMSKKDAISHGSLKVGVLETYAGQHIVIGDISKKNINKPNWYISKMLFGDVPDNCR